MARYGLVDKNGRTGVPLQKIQVRGTLIGFTAEVTATMEYINSTDNPIEAIYVFPLDEEAAVCGFQATIDGRTIVAEVQEKQEARDTYDDAISSGHNAYLLEESDESSDIFQINVGNLPPKKSATVQITFVAGLAVEQEERVVFVLPTVLNPRYTPTDSQHSLTTTMLTIASVSTKYSFDFELDVQCTSAIHEITSPCNRLKVDIDPDDNRRAKVRLDEEYQFDADVQVHVLGCKPFEPHAMLEDCVTPETNDVMSKPVVMLNFFPEFHSSAALERGEFIFVVDRSGSMGGPRIKSARETLLLFLKSLPDECYFNVVGFGNSFQKLFKKSKAYNDSSVDNACSHAQSMEADLGGTEILTPLEYVFSQPLIKGYPRQVFLLTDGEVRNTQQVIDLTRRNADKARCFALGIGSGASTALIKGVARAGRGKAELVISADHMQAKVIKMLKNALQPALLDCKVTWDLPKECNAESVPNPLPAVFSGESLVVYGVLSLTENKDVKPLIGTVTLTATLSTASGGEQVTHKVSFEGVSSHSGENKLLHRLAAKALIQAKQQHQDDLNRDDEKEDIIRLSKSANVISKLTSFVAVDKENHEPVSRPMTKPPSKKLLKRKQFKSASMMGGRSCYSGPVCKEKSPPNMLPLSDKKRFPGSTFFNAIASFGGGAESCSSAETSAKGRTMKKSKSFRPSFSFKRREKKKEKVMSSPRCKAPNIAPTQDVSPDILREYDSSVDDGITPQRKSNERERCYDALSIEDAEEGEDVGRPLPAFGFSPPPKPKPKGNDLLDLVSLQKASGSWQLTEQLARICGVTIDKLKQTCLSQLTASNKESLWATALALSCLFGKFKDQKDEWEMVAGKGIKWLKKTIDNEALSYENIMEMADNALGN